MVHLDDVRSGFTDDGGHSGQYTRCIGNLQAKTDHAAIPHETVLDHHRQHPAVDVATRQDKTHLAPAKAFGMGEKAGERRSPSAFRNRLLDFQIGLDGVFQAGLSLTRTMSDTRSRTIGMAFFPGVFTAMPSAMVRPPAFNLQPLELLVHRGEHLGLDTDDFRFRADGSGGNGDAANQPAATDRDDDDIKVGRILEHLEGEGPLPCHDVVIMIGMDKDEILVGRHQMSGHGRIVDGLACQDDPGAKALGISGPLLPVPLRA